MQNLVPESMKLNKFVHSEIPDNSLLFLRVNGKTIPRGSDEVQIADFTSRKLEKIQQQEAKFISAYQEEMNRLDREASGTSQSSDTDQDTDTQE